MRRKASAQVTIPIGTGKIQIFLLASYALSIKKQAMVMFGLVVEQNRFIF
jgi:hypothetical protein